MRSDVCKHDTSAAQTHQSEGEALSTGVFLTKCASLCVPVHTIRIHIVVFTTGKQSKEMDMFH